MSMTYFPNVTFMPPQRIKDGDLVRHFKGKLYRVLLTNAHYSEDHSLRLVVYQSQETDEIWVRPYDMFMSEVDKVKYPDVQQKYRFEVVGEEDNEEKKK